MKMSLMRRIAALFKIKVGKALDSAEDPREVLDYSYSKQLELLQQVRRGVADVATSRKRVELQLTGLQQSADKLDGQARQALAVGRDDLAREALTRRAASLTQIRELQPQRDAVKSEEDKLVVAQQRLQAKVEAFRTRKETIKATYTAGRGAEPHQRSHLRYLRGDGRCRPGDAARGGQDRADAVQGPGTGRAAGLRGFGRHVATPGPARPHPGCPRRRDGKRHRHRP
jgi:hypothetical protein